jgi:hypothetical protein
MEDIRMRDRELQEKRAREAAQKQHSAGEGSAESPQGKHQARSGEKGKKTPEQQGGRGRSPSGAANRMQTIGDDEAASAQRRSAQAQQEKGGKGRGLGRGGPRAPRAGKGRQSIQSDSDDDVAEPSHNVETTEELQELNKVCASAQRASLLSSYDLTLLGGIKGERVLIGIHIPGGYSPNRPNTTDHEIELVSI